MTERIWRLSSDVVIRPVVDMPPDVIAQAIRANKNPQEYFGIERKQSRSNAKIVNRDVVEVLKAFGEEGATYEEVLNRFLALKNLKREELHHDMWKMVRTFISDNFLVEGRKPGDAGSEAIIPSFSEGDVWLSYRIRRNVHVIIDTEIYMVEHIPSGEPRALKITRPSFPRPELREKIFQRLAHEFAVIEKLAHPSIVKIHERGVHEGRMYGILDWIEGRSVYTFAHESGSDPDDVLLMRLSIECLEALDAVHRAGYLHGDVHTRNFLVHDGHIRLIDFGLSRPIQVRESEAGSYVEGGVTRFMPPEYVAFKLEKKRGLWGSVAGEVYSCGVMIFSLFTKSYPYKWSFYRDDFMDRILTDPVPSFEECEREAWPELESVLHTALEKEPAKRYASATDFVDALRCIPVPRTRGGN